MHAPASEPTILSLPAARLVDVAVRLGMERSALLRGVSLVEADLADRMRHIPVRTLYDLWAAVARAVGGAGLPFEVARAVELEEYGVLGFALLTSRSGEEALERLLGASALITTSGRWSLRRGGETVQLTWSRPAPPSLGVRLSNEAAIALAVQQARLSGLAARALRVTFRHARPVGVTAHTDFFQCPVLFGQPADAVQFSADALAGPPRLANRAMSEYFARAVADELRGAATASFGARVRRAVSDSLAAGAPMAEVARRLALSERSLRRRLDREGTGFRDLLDEVRREHAWRWLRDTGAGLDEVAAALGFSEPTALARACRRWFGTAPGRLRAAAARG